MKSRLSKRKLPAKVFKRATGLLELHRGKSQVAIAQTLNVSRAAVAQWRNHYL